MAETWAAKQNAKLTDRELELLDNFAERLSDCLVHRDCDCDVEPERL